MERLVLWGHHLDEYRDMFDLPDAALGMRFLEFQSGVSAFQYELRGIAAHLLSYDTWFDLSQEALREKVTASFSARLAQIRAEITAFDLNRYDQSIEKLVHYRQQGIEHFFADYDLGHAEGRYVCPIQPELPFPAFFFDYALSAHHFFSNMAPQTLDYHVKTIIDLAHVAKEIRIFPLVDALGKPSELLGPVILALQQKNYGIEVRKVGYHLQPRGDAMLRIWAQQCEV